MEIKELKNILTKNLKNYGKEVKIRFDGIKENLTEYEFALQQEFDFITYINFYLHKNKQLTQYFFGSEKTLMPDDPNYNYLYDRVNGDFYMKHLITFSDTVELIEELRFDLKVSTEKNKKYVGPIGKKSWNDFKGYNHFYLCLAYDGSALYLVDSTKIQETDFIDGNNDAIFGKTLEKLYQKKRAGIEKIKI